eukprot:12559765-Alexandrium_andersonii.AAC.1
MSVTAKANAHIDESLEATNGCWLADRIGDHLGGPQLPQHGTSRCPVSIRRRSRHARTFYRATRCARRSSRP